jgi:hypothetical protein
MAGNLAQKIPAVAIGATEKQYSDVTLMFPAPQPRPVSHECVTIPVTHGNEQVTRITHSKIALLYCYLQ